MEQDSLSDSAENWPLTSANSQPDRTNQNKTSPKAPAICVFPVNKLPELERALNAIVAEIEYDVQKEKSHSFKPAAGFPENGLTFFHKQNMHANASTGQAYIPAVFSKTAFLMLTWQGQET